MKCKKIFRSIFITLLLCNTLLHAHGFGANTLVKNAAGSWNTIDQLTQMFHKRKTHILSYDVESKTYVEQRIKTAAHGTTNCYFKIGFAGSPYHDITCTPTQEFYLPLQNKWVATYQLYVGDILLGENNELKPIERILFFEKPLNVFSLEGKKIHNFFVGQHAVLTHNMVLPSLYAGLGFAFGSGAAAGGAAGSWLGPIGITGGIVLGGLTAVVAKTIFGKKSVKYTLQFDPNTINNIKKSGGNVDAGFPDPEDPDDEKNETKEQRNGKYEDAAYHHKNSRGYKSPAPKNGQKALDNSVQIKDTSPHRIGVSEGEIVVLNKTSDNMYHGHVRNWNQLNQIMKNALVKSKFVTKKGKVI